MINVGNRLSANCLNARCRYQIELIAMPMLGIFQPNYISGIGMRITCTSEVYNAARKVSRRTIGVRMIGGEGVFLKTNVVLRSVHASVTKRVWRSQKSIKILLDVLYG